MAARDCDSPSVRRDFMLTLRLTNREAKALRTVAARDGTSISEYVRRMIVNAGAGHLSEVA